jgi:hypothetical protein
MDNVMHADLNAVPGPEVTGELSDAELEFVVGGLTRAYPSPIEIPGPSVTPLDAPLLKPTGV